MLLLSAIAVLALALALAVWSSRLRHLSGLPTGRVIYSDTGAWQRNDQSFFSSVHRITGKPDYLVCDNTGIIPVEVKSGLAPATPRHGHVLQLAAYCLMVEESMGIRPSYGIIKYDDQQFAVNFTQALEQELLNVVHQMRSSATHPDGPRRNHRGGLGHAEVQRCHRCGVRASCNERLAD